MLGSALIATPVMLLLTVVQTAVLPRFPVLGVIPSLPFAVALAWGLLRGLDEGAIWAFVGGLFMDLFSIAPAGGSSLTYMVAVVAASILKDVLPPNRFLIPILLGVVAATVQALLYMLYLRLFGYSSATTLSLLSTQLLVQTTVFLPIYWLLDAARRLLRPRPVTI